MSQLSEQQKSAWAEHIRAQRESGLNQQAYCRQNDLKPHQFWYWKSKLDGGTDKQVKCQSKSKQSGFVPVKMPTRTSTQSLSVNLPNGITVSGIDEHNHGLAQQLIGSLT